MHYACLPGRAACPRAERSSALQFLDNFRINRIVITLLSTPAGAGDVEIGVVGALRWDAVIARGVFPNGLQDG